MASLDHPRGADEHGEGSDGAGDDPKGSTTLYIGIGGSLLLIATVIGTAAVFYAESQREAARKLYDQGWPQYAEMKAAQQAELNSYRWMDSEKKVVGLKIDRAMELVVSETKAGKK